MSSLKAYKISCRDADHGAVVGFAERGKEIDRRSNDNCNCEFLDRYVHRAPEFDKYAPGPVTVQQYLAEGWYWCCSGCSDQVWSGVEEGDDEQIIVTPRGHCYHSIACLLADYERVRHSQPNWHESMFQHKAELEAIIAERGQTVTAQPESV